MTATFLDYWALDYKRLLPVIPPNADISDKSSLFKRVGTHQDGRGKTPGIKGRGGKWFGFDWINHNTDEEDLRRWQHMGAGIGVKTGEGLIAIDADTLDLEAAKTIRAIVERHVGLVPVRIGRDPKALYLVRVSDPLPYMRVEFGDLNDKGRPKDRVELLSDGKQFVAHGIHPKTGKPYTWPRKLVPYAELPIFPSGALIAMMEELRAALPAARPLVTEGAAASGVDQASLRGDPEKVRKAVSLTPNTSEHFPSRESYLAVGYSIKAALPDDPDEAFSIFSEWAERWRDEETGEINEPEIVEADWQRMKPPFKRGANWLYEIAEQHAPKDFTRAEVWFEPIADAPSNAFDQVKPEEVEHEPLQPIAWINPADWQGAEPPARRWIVKGMIPDGEVTLLTGKGGVGKTLLAQQLGTSVAQGVPFLGHAVTQCKVMAFLCEDAPDELHIRQRDINTSLCLNMTDIAPNLRIASRKYMDNLLATFDRNTSTMKRTAVWRQFAEDAKAFGAKLVIIDTIADTFGGSEIDRSQVRQFVQGCLGRLAQEIGGACLALGHPSRAGESSGEGTSGSTAWHASVRSRLYLEHATKDGSGPLRRLSNKKANYGPAGDVYVLRWSRGAFDLMSAKRSAIDGEGSAETGAAGGLGGSGSVPTMAAAIDAAVMSAVELLKAEQVELSMAINSPHYAPRVMQTRLSTAGLVAAYSKEEIAAGIEGALKAGRVWVARVGYKSNRHPKMGLSTEPPAAFRLAETPSPRVADSNTETPINVFQ